MRREDDQRVFTDRIEALAAFDTAWRDLSVVEPSVLVFHGLPGIGKSYLKEHIVSLLRDGTRYPATVWASVPFDTRIVSEPEIAMAICSESLKTTSNNKLRFPLFEVASAIHWHKKNPLTPVEPKNTPYFRIGSIFFDALSAIGGAVAVSQATGTIDFQTVTAGMAAVVPLMDALCSYPQIRKIFGKSQKARDKLRGLEFEEPERIMDRLPEFFGDDLLPYISKGAKSVIFLDGFEGLYRREGYVKGGSEWVRTWIDNCRGVLFVICSREPIAWASLLGDEGEKWAPRVTHFPLTEFALKDTSELIAGELGENLEDDVVRAIQEASRGVPFYIWLCNETVKRLHNRGEEVDATTIGWNYEKIFARFVTGLDKEEYATLEIVSIAEEFDYNLFEALVNKFETGYPLNRFHVFVRFSFIQNTNEPGFFKVHDLLRRHFRAVTENDDTERLKYGETPLEPRVTVFLFDYYRSQGGIASPLEYSSGKGRALVKALAYGAELDDPFPVAEWFNSVFRDYYEASAIKPMGEILNHLSIIEGKCGVNRSEDAVIPQLRCGLALMYIDNRRFREAGALLSRGISDVVRRSGRGNKEIARFISILGYLKRLEHKYKQAEKCLRLALERKKQFYGREHKEYGYTLNLLTLVCLDLNNPEEALPLAKELVRLRRLVVGRGHPHYVWSLTHLANCYKRIGDYRKSQLVFRVVLKGWERCYGRESMAYSYGENDLGVLLTRQRLYEKAAPFLEESLNIKEKFCPPDSLALALARSNYGDVCTELGHFDEANALLKNALRVRLRRLGLWHNFTGMTVRHLGRMYLLKGDYTKAMACLRQAIKILEIDKPGDPYWINRAWVWLGITYDKLGRPENAEECRRRAEEFDSR